MISDEQADKFVEALKLYRLVRGAMCHLKEQLGNRRCDMVGRPRQHVRATSRTREDASERSDGSSTPPVAH